MLKNIIDLRLDGVVEIIETFHETVAGSKPGARILFFSKSRSF